MSRYYDYFREQEHAAGAVTIDEFITEPCGQTLSLRHWRKDCTINAHHG